MIKPLGKNIVLEKEEKQETFINGVYLSEDEKSKSHVGKIIAISTELSKDGAFEAKINNKVIYREYAGTEIELNNKKLVLISVDDILGVVEE